MKKIFFISLVLLLFSCEKQEDIGGGGLKRGNVFKVTVHDFVTEEPIFNAVVSIKTSDINNEIEDRFTDHLGQARFVFDKKLKNETLVTVTVSKYGYEDGSDKNVIYKKEGEEQKDFIVTMQPIIAEDTE